MIFKTNKKLKEQAVIINNAKQANLMIRKDYEDLLDMSTSERVVTDVIGEGLTYYDYQSLPVNERRNYYRLAQEFLKSEFVKNESKELIAGMIGFIAMNSKDFDEVKDIRMTINGLQLLKERASRIENPDATEKATRNNIHSAL